MTTVFETRKQTISRRTNKKKPPRRHKMKGEGNSLSAATGDGGATSVIRVDWAAGEIAVMGVVGPAGARGTGDPIRRQGRV